MNTREISAALGMGRPFFFARWSRKSHILDNARDIQDRTNSIFIHIPKTAGMSVWKSIYKSEGLFGHPPAWAYISQDAPRFNKYFTFSLLRDPGARFVSAFYFMKSGGLTQQDKIWADSVLGDFDSPNALIAAMKSPILRGKVLSWKHFTPQSWYITDVRGRVAVDFLGSVENFDVSMSEIAKRLNIDEYECERVNATKVKPRDIDISEDSTNLLRNVYEKDFEIYSRISTEQDLA